MICDRCKKDFEDKDIEEKDKCLKKVMEYSKKYGNSKTT